MTVSVVYSAVTTFHIWKQTDAAASDVIAQSPSSAMEESQDDITSDNLTSASWCWIARAVMYISQRPTIWRQDLGYGKPFVQNLPVSCMASHLYKCISYIVIY